MWIKHDSGEATELRNQQVLGDDSPLEFDENGFAEVDEERGRKLLAMHRHIERGGHGPVEDDGGGDKPPDEDVEPPFDPSEKTVDELQDALEQNEYSDAELEALAEAEADGKNRETALEAIEAELEEE